MRSYRPFFSEAQRLVGAGGLIDGVDVDLLELLSQRGAHRRHVVDQQHFQARKALVSNRSHFRVTLFNAYRSGKRLLRQAAYGSCLERRAKQGRSLARRTRRDAKVVPVWTRRRLSSRPSPAPHSEQGRSSESKARRNTAIGERGWSGRRVSNSRPQAWEAGALPTELLPLGRPSPPRSRPARILMHFPQAMTVDQTVPQRKASSADIPECMAIMAPHPSQRQQPESDQQHAGGFGHQHVG